MQVRLRLPKMPSAQVTRLADIRGRCHRLGRPYTYLGASQPLGFQSRDIGLFQDSDGTAYLLTEDRANRLRIDKLSADYLSVVSAGSSNGGSVALMQDLEALAMVHIGSTSTWPPRI